MVLSAVLGWEAVGLGDNLDIEMFLNFSCVIGIPRKYLRLTSSSSYSFFLEKLDLHVSWRVSIWLGGYLCMVIHNLSSRCIDIGGYGWIFGDIIYRNMWLRSLYVSSRLDILGGERNWYTRSGTCIFHAWLFREQVSDEVELSLFVISVGIMVGKVPYISIL